MAGAIDIFVIYKIIKALILPFDETEAFKLGLIDKDGKRLKKAKTKEEKKAMTYFDRFIFNLKRLLHKAGLKSRFSNMAAAFFLLRESESYETGTFNYNDEQIIEEIKKIMEELKMKSNKTLEQLEEEIANATGSAVAGTIWCDNSSSGTISIKLNDGSDNLTLFSINTSTNAITLPGGVSVTESDPNAIPFAIALGG